MSVPSLYDWNKRRNAHTEVPLARELVVDDRSVNAVMDAGGLLPEARSADHHPSGKCHGKDDLQANEWSEMHDTPCHLAPFPTLGGTNFGDRRKTRTGTPHTSEFRVILRRSAGCGRGGAYALG
ncbi:putative signal transduction histidine kinase [Microbacterium sp. TS-1]|nr:putative signal transduction histidine kinase [Microbacterium sp. TS-1]